jgi:hypothetical protein
VTLVSYFERNLKRHSVTTWFDHNQRIVLIRGIWLFTRTFARETLRVKLGSTPNRVQASARTLYFLLFL